MKRGLRFNSARLLLTLVDSSGGYLATWPETPGAELKLELTLPTRNISLSRNTLRMLSAEKGMHPEAGLNIYRARMPLALVQ